jgi:hypothetical protein
MLSLCLLAAVLPSSPVHAAMSTPGQFSVSESGAATYSIPIQMPPGTAGIAPKLTLSYNGNGGNGLLGMGWSLSGLSGVSRCPRTMAQDGVRGSVNFDANDRYCLDGQRLIAINGTYGADGTEYRTEQEGFAKIVSYGAAGNGPAWFKVWTKSGQIIEYGNTADSRIEAQGKTTVGAWALNKLQDTKGNYFMVKYTEDNANGDYYPQRIDYTGNAGQSPTAAVQFSYEARPDVTPRYSAGSLIKNGARMTHVATYVNGALIKDYQLAYQTGTATSLSRLASLTECDAVPKCLPPVTFGWQDAGSANLTGWQVFSPNSGGGQFDLNACRGLQAVDINGDGKTDLVCPYDHGGANTTTYAQISQGAGSTAWQAWSPNTGGGQFDLNKCKIIQMADVNGDGLPDLVCVYNYTGTGNSTAFVQLNQTTGFSAWQAWGGNPVANLDPANCKGLYLTDINGDGKADLVCAYDHGGANTTTFARVNSGSSFGAWQSWSPNTGGGQFDLNMCKIATMADVNGDGLPDLVCVYNYAGTGNSTAFVQLNQTIGFSAWQAWGANPASSLDPANCKGLYLADINGDGKADLVCPYNHGGANTTTFVRLNDGTGFTAWLNWSPNTGGGQFDLNACKTMQLVDINGDGRPDLVCPYDHGGANTTTYAQINQGNAFAGWQAWSPNSGGGQFDLNACKTLNAADSTGDGKADLICPYDHGGANTTTYAQKVGGAMPDLLSSISNGIGATVAISYKSLTENFNYVKGTGAVYPKYDLQFPMYVVSSASTANGVGATLTTNYRYGELRSSLDRGLLGFGWVEATQAETGILTATDYFQDWPYIGMPSRVRKVLPGSGNGGLLSQVTNTYGCTDFVSSSGCTVTAGRRYFPYVSQSTETSWDLNGAALPTIISSSQYDAWGNPTQIVVTTGDGYTKTTTNTYVNDTSNWFLGRLTRAAVTSITP